MTCATTGATFDPTVAIFAATAATSGPTTAIAGATAASCVAIELRGATGRCGTIVARCAATGGMCVAIDMSFDTTGAIAGTIAKICIMTDGSAGAIALISSPLTMFATTKPGLHGRASLRIVPPSRL